MLKPQLLGAQRCVNRITNMGMCKEFEEGHIVHVTNRNE